MKKYIGEKQVKAQPMTADEAISKGYKIGNHEHEDGYEVQYPDEYKSWSPKAVFEEAYKVADTFVDRLNIELSDLSEKNRKIREFFITDVFKSLPVVKQKLMHAQFEAMLAYKAILTERIRTEKEG